MLTELSAPTGNYRGRLLLVVAWIEQCLLRLVDGSDPRLSITIKKARKKGLIDDEMTRALEAIAAVRQRVSDRALAHHELFSSVSSESPLSVILELRGGYDDLESLENEHQLVFQFAVAIFIHLSAPADHPSSAVRPIRLVWRP